MENQSEDRNRIFVAEDGFSLRLFCWKVGREGAVKKVFDFQLLYLQDTKEKTSMVLGISSEFTGCSFKTKP